MLQERCREVGSVSVPANGHIARLLDQFIPGFGNQSGGYIRLTSDQPIAAWEIYGTATAMASGPTLVGKKKGPQFSAIEQSGKPGEIGK